MWMRYSNIVTLDSKGRILLPGHLRRSLEAESGMEILLIPDQEGGHIKLLPLIKNRTVELKLHIPDYMGSMASVLHALGDYNLAILMSESRSLVRGKLIEWNLIADMTGCPDLDKLTAHLSAMPQVKRLEITRHGQKPLHQQTKSL